MSETAITITVRLSQEHADHIRKVGHIEWGAVEAKADLDHVADFCSTLKLTREHFGLQGDQKLHGIYKRGTDIVEAHTGTSPNSGLRASLLTALWNEAHDALIAEQLSSESEHL